MTSVTPPTVLVEYALTERLISSETASEDVKRATRPVGLVPISPFRRSYRARMPFEFLTALERGSDDAPAAAALVAAAKKTVGKDYPFGIRPKDRGVELTLAIDVLWWDGHRSRETRIGHGDPDPDWTRRDWTVPYLPNERAAALACEREFSDAFSPVEFFEQFQRVGLPFLMRAHYMREAGPVPGLASVPGGVSIGFRDREDVLDFLISEDFLMPTYDRLRIQRVEVLDRLAQALVLVRGSAALWKRLFCLLAEVRPESFHPYLGVLRPGNDPEDKAFVDAPEDAVAQYAQLLAGASTPPITDSAASAAVLALLHCGRPQQLQIVNDYLVRACSSQAALEQASLLALRANHATYGGTDPRVVPIALRSCFDVIVESGSGGGRGSSVGGHTAGVCSNCDRPLRSVFDISRRDVPLWKRKRDLSVDTCADCIVHHLDPYFVQYPWGVHPRTYLPPNAPAGEPTTQTRNLRPRTSIRLEPTPSSRGHLADNGERDCYTRIGGNPSWLGPPRAIICPACTIPMLFVAQSGRVPGMWARLILAFECRACRIVATTLEGLSSTTVHLREQRPRSE